MTTMPRLACRRPASLAATVALCALLAACGASDVTPSGAAPSRSAAVPGSGGPSAGAASPSGGSPAPSGSVAPSLAASLPPPSEPASPPPSGDPEDDEACLAVVPRDDVETALDTTVGIVVGVGDDPAVSLTCTYPASGGGTLLMTASAGNTAAAYQASLELTTGYGQKPVAIAGLGDQAFYAIPAGGWPEQVVFSKGPVLVRLLNQTPATIGPAAFTALATTAAEAIAPAP